MGLYAVCIGYQKDNFRSSKNQVSQSKIESNDNKYAAMNCFAPGIEINPADGEFLVIDRINNSDSFMVSIGGINQNIAPTTDRGERLIYSVSPDGKTKKAFMHFKNDGSIDLAADAAKKFTMTFGTSKIEFSATGMKITTPAGTYNALTHIHQTGVGPSSSPTPNT